MGTLLKKQCPHLSVSDVHVLQPRGSRKLCLLDWCQDCAAADFRGENVCRRLGGLCFSQEGSRKLRLLDDSQDCAAADFRGDTAQALFSIAP